MAIRRLIIIYVKNVTGQVETSELNRYCFKFRLLELNGIQNTPRIQHVTVIISDNTFIGNIYMKNESRVNIPTFSGSGNLLQICTERRVWLPSGSGSYHDLYL